MKVAFIGTHGTPALVRSVADIFDALTASDRPYKRAVPTDKAIDILGFEVKDGHLDSELVQLFVDSKAWQSLSALRTATP